THCVDFVVFNFGENDLLFNPDVVVATAIERTTGNTTEVAHARQCHGDQAIQEFVHAAATQGDHAADGIIFTDLEARDSLARFGDNRLLAGDLGQVGDGVVDDLLVGNRFGHTHVQGDLADARHFHDAFVANFGLQVGHDLVAVKLL